MVSSISLISILNQFLNFISQNMEITNQNNIMEIIYEQQKNDYYLLLVMEILPWVVYFLFFLIIFF